VRDRLEGAVFGALVGDALALGAHYEYDREKIWRAYGGQVIGSLDKPGSKNRASGLADSSLDHRSILYWNSVLF
jgi:hypothetical protein